MPEPAAESRAQIEARRERLRQLMGRVEKALAAPTGPDVAAWAEQAGVVADELAAALEQHVAETERPGGILDDVLQTAPRLSNRADELRVEHQRLLKSARSLQELLGAGSSDDFVAAPARAAGVALLGELVLHRQAGADLLYEAYWIDVSTGD